MECLQICRTTFNSDARRAIPFTDWIMGKRVITQLISARYTPAISADMHLYLTPGPPGTMSGADFIFMTKFPLAPRSVCYRCPKLKPTVSSKNLTDVQQTGT